MIFTDERKRMLQKAAKVTALVALAVLCILLLVALAIRIYLATSLPAAQLSNIATDFLHEKVTIQSVDTSDGMVLLKGVRLKNPAGFPEGNLAEADLVAIAPQWGALVRGGQRFRLIALRGIRVSLEKNSSGDWNYSNVQKVLAARKPSPTETFIKELAIKDGSLKLQGESVQGISLQVFNLTTKGSRASSIDLAFEDPAHNRYFLKGMARPGKDLALALSLTAPSLSLQDTAAVLKLKNAALYQGGKGSLKVDAGLHRGELNLVGDLSFSGMHLPAAQKSYPVEGNLHFAGGYSLQNATAALQSCALTVKNLVKLRAAGRMTGLTTARDFSLDLGMEEVSLGTLNFLVPEASSHNLLFGGKLRCDRFHLEGNRSQGVKSASGTLELNDGVAFSGDRLLVEGVSGRVELSRQAPDMLANGTLSVAGRHDKALLQQLSIPFALTLSSTFKPLKGSVPSFSATVAGTPVTGRAAFDAAKDNPIAASLKVPSASLPALNPQLKPLGLQASSGTASLVLDLAGKNVNDLAATGQVQLSGFRGKRGNDSIALGRGSIAAKLQRTGGRLLAQGNAQLTALTLGGKNGDARFGFRLAERMLYLDNGHADLAGTGISVARLSALLPGKETAAKSGSRYSLQLDFAGASLKQGNLEVGNLSGRLRGGLNSDETGKWLDGTADLASGAVNWQGKKLAAPLLHAVLSRPGAKGMLSGDLFGGKMSGTASFNPFQPNAGVSFDVGVKGADAAEAASLLPPTSTTRPSAGLLDLRLNGTYSGRSGLSCRFQSKGSGVAIVGAGGKTLISGAGLSMTGALSGGTLTLSEAVLSAAPGVALKLKGEVNQALSPKRAGTVTFSLPETALNSVVDPFANILPRFLQEATVDGTVAADGRLELREGKDLLEGGLTVKNGRVEVSSQKLVLADIGGRIPLSLDLSGKSGGIPQETMSFSRENYPRLLAKLKQVPPGGEVLTFGKIAFGPVELGKVNVHLSAANGVTQISSVRASVFNGTLIGKGAVSVRQKLSYRGDLLINDLSLKTLCSVFPGIKGYISGRVDGVISLSGEGSGLKGITGFTDLWAREAKGEKMVVSKEFLQRLAKQKLAGFFFRSDRPYDKAEITAMLEEGDLTFDTLIIQHTNFFGVRDLSVAIAPEQNRIALDHLLDSIKEAAVRGKPTTGAQPQQAPAEAAPAETAPAETAPPTEFKWGE